MHVITVLRAYLGYTQTRLSQEAGITQPDLSEMEKLKPYGYPDKYIRVSKVLGIPVDCLLKNDFTGIPESFFDAHPPQEYRAAVASEEGLLGRDGEEYILLREQERLSERFPALARLVLPFFKMKGGWPGYDILSFDDDGHPICLEVKTFSSHGNDFRFTRNEMEAARKLTREGEDYRVVLIRGWGTKELQVRDILFTQLEQDFRIEPYHYCCTPIPQRDKKPLTGIAYYRRIRGLRQMDLAEELGMHACHLSLYETGERQPQVDFYLRLSELLHVSVDDLLMTYDASLLEEVD